MNWIKLSDQEPPLRKNVLVYTNAGECFIVWTVDNFAYNLVQSMEFLRSRQITHWAEIVPPESGEN